MLSEQEKTDRKRENRSASGRSVSQHKGLDYFSFLSTIHSAWNGFSIWRFFEQFFTTARYNVSTTKFHWENGSDVEEYHWMDSSTGIDSMFTSGPRFKPEGLVVSIYLKPLKNHRNHTILWYISRFTTTLLVSMSQQLTFIIFLMHTTIHVMDISWKILYMSVETSSFIEVRSVYPDK